MVPSPKNWFVNHAKLLVALLVGALTIFAMPDHWSLLTRALLSWNATALSLMSLIFWHLGRLPARQLCEHYADDDPTAPVILVIVTAAAVLSIAAIVAFLATLKSVPQPQRAYHVLLATVTLVDSWLLVPTMFTAHYADVFYSAPEQQRPLNFPHTAEPVFWDFVYFSFTISAACQTADVSTQDTGIRRLVTLHTLIAFLFNLAILGFAINVTAGLLA